MKVATSKFLMSALLSLVFVLAFCSPARTQLIMGPEELVEANGIDIAVQGYSVPSFVFWNGDSLRDLVIGEGGGTSAVGKVRVYLNAGTNSGPVFTSYFYAQSLGSDVTVPASGCLGIFPRVVDFNIDGRKDLLAGLADGAIKVYLNTNTDADPRFDGGTFLQVGAPGSKVNINVGARATSVLVDWNSDGKKDLVAGALDGKLHIYINEGSDSSPDYRIESFAQENGADLVVPSWRSSPYVDDLDNDGKKDLLTGNTEGQVLLYSNVGSDQAPVFSGYMPIEADSVPIDLPGLARSRPFVCDWTGDGLLDVLVGAGDGLVHLYQGVGDIISVSSDKTQYSSGTASVLNAYPNPSNPDVTISFVLAKTSRVRLSVRDLAGRRVALLMAGVFDQGTHLITWKGVDERGREVSSGLYFVWLDVDGVTSSGKVVLVR